jgi:predicted flap endonuclease-1-like 5' DNA nuclease
MFNQNPFVGPGTQSTSVHALEMIVMLAMAFLLGYLLSRFLSVKERAKLAAAEKQAKKLTTDNTELLARLSAQEKESELLKDRIAQGELEKVELREIVKDVVTSMDATEQQAATEPEDDLKKIEGIGPKIEKILHKEGIHSFAQLADADEVTLKEILMRQGERFRVHNPQTWPLQATLARDKKWNELKLLQADLQGGRRK